MLHNVPSSSTKYWVHFPKRFSDSPSVGFSLELLTWCWLGMFPTLWKFCTSTVNGGLSCWFVVIPHSPVNVSPLLHFSVRSERWVLLNHNNRVIFVTYFCIDTCNLGMQHYCTSSSSKILQYLIFQLDWTHLLRWPFCYSNWCTRWYSLLLRLHVLLSSCKGWKIYSSQHYQFCKQKLV